MKHINQKFKISLIDFKTMNIVFYSKKEFNDMKNNLTKQLNQANKKIARLEAKIKELSAKNA